MKTAMEWALAMVRAREPEAENEVVVDAYAFMVQQIQEDAAASLSQRVARLEGAAIPILAVCKCAGRGWLQSFYVGQPDVPCVCKPLRDALSPADDAGGARKGDG